MQPSIKTLLALGFACSISVASMLAQDVYTFDEYGNSEFTPFFAPISQGGLEGDPTLGVPLPTYVLWYGSGLPFVGGDVVLTEPGNPGVYSDVIRFWDPNPNAGTTGSQIIFYSTTDAMASAPADSGLPTQLTNPVFIPETDPVVVYNPAPGQPGSLPASPYGVTYDIIVTVPEPNALALAILGGGLLLFTFKRRSQAST